MIITIKQLAKKSDPGLATLVGVGPLDQADRTTLRAFGGLSFEVSDNALPLRFYFLSGNTKRLGIFPSKDGLIDIPGGHVGIKSGDAELILFREPDPETKLPTKTNGGAESAF